MYVVTYRRIVRGLDDNDTRKIDIKSLRATVKSAARGKGTNSACSMENFDTLRVS